MKYVYKYAEKLKGHATNCSMSNFIWTLKIASFSKGYVIKFFIGGICQAPKQLWCSVLDTHMQWQSVPVQGLHQTVGWLSDLGWAWLSPPSLWKTVMTVQHGGFSFIIGLFVGLSQLQASYGGWTEAACQVSRSWIWWNRAYRYKAALGILPGQARPCISGRTTITDRISKAPTRQRWTGPLGRRKRRFHYWPH